MNKGQTDVNRIIKMFFGFFMVLVYLGMAVMMAVNFFDWSNAPLWRAVRWLFAIMFAAYGIYRGYREIKGEHTYGMRRYDDETD
jgi:FtsH-binding integral membrane protein